MHLADVTGTSVKLGYLSDWPILLWYIRQVISQKLFLSLLEIHLLLLFSYLSPSDRKPNGCPESAQSISTQTGSATLTQTTHKCGPPTAWSSAVRTPPTYTTRSVSPLRTSVSACLVLFSPVFFFLLRWSTMILVKCTCIFCFHPEGCFFLLIWSSISLD